MRALERSMASWVAGALGAVTLSCACATVWAQTGGQSNSAAAQPGKPAGASPRPEDLEPGVNTSATSLSSPEPAPAPVSAPKPADSAVKPSPVSHSRQKSPAPAATPTSAAPAQLAPATAGTAVRTPKSGAGAGKSQDRIELDTTQITGNRELPKVLYIVPWKRSDLGDLVGKPVNSLLDEVLTPVDRDVFKRENRYYDALKPDDARQAPGAAAASGEKH